MANRKSRKEPVLLTHVLQAVADLRELNGSTLKRIVEAVQANVCNSKCKISPNNLAIQVKRAVCHAVNAGVVMQKSGKFKLAIGPESCAKSLVSVRKQVKQLSSKRRTARGDSEPHESESRAASSYVSSEASTRKQQSGYSLESAPDEPQRKQKRRVQQRQKIKKKVCGRKRRNQYGGEDKNEDDDPQDLYEDQDQDNHDQNHQLEDSMLNAKRIRKTTYEYDNNEYEDGLNDCDNPNCLCGNMKPNVNSLEQYDDDMLGQDDY